MIKVNAKLWQLNLGRIMNDPDPWGMKVWVTPPGKESWAAEVFAESEGNTEWEMEEGSYKYQLWPGDQLQK